MFLRIGKFMGTIVVGLSLLGLAGCQTTGGLGQGEEGAAVDEAGAMSGGADARGAAAGGRFSSAALDDPNSPLANRVFYFDFDSFMIKDEDRSTISAHGEFLAANPDAKVRLEGHADERGSREYNIALGERRANAVRQLLQLQGVAAGQIETVSYGEERPAGLGHDEQSWSLNRRVELIYTRR
ncbi:peptidoglycan-associated lipoprotein Pal [Thioalbus denitrificans]|uniref:Peptidoglycan-associated lipoprotein n=1 Tax=Thioalbus denitrificans TaxID=547122 RepID=A0A369C3F3_9GAMM|nr:peptidoglycan-associated lipoprotein Pal [Thioalbus denitrificans]RCX28429.1 peptidoglycan-associated lipoprotein [Thioalbus denitrificans]